jgi:hypothetical protein
MRRGVRGQCPSCGRDSLATRGALNKDLKKYLFYLSIAGLAGMLIGTRYYPPLDRDRLLVASICIVFLTVVTHLIVSARGRLAVNVGRLRTGYILSGGIVLLLAACATANGMLDMKPRTIGTPVIRKDIASGKSSATYRVWVPSWRQGKQEEGLTVGRDLYRTLKVREAFVVDIHPGVLGMRWYSRVGPRQRTRQ